MLTNQWINKQLRGGTKALSRLTKQPLILTPPQHAAIAFTSVCKLRCPMCKLGQKKLDREIGLMDFDKFRRLIDEISPFVRRISFPWYGEPFTHKNFEQFVRYASEKGLSIRIQTNGTFLHKCSLDFLTECNIHLISIAIDGLDQKTYEVYRVGGNLDEVTAGVRKLATLRADRNSKYPEHIRMNFIAMRHNEHQLDQVQDFAKKIGADSVKVKTAHVDRTEEGKKFLPTDPKYRRYEDDFCLKSGRDHEPGCRSLWRSAVISWDGTMGLCCIDSDCEYSPGNVFDEGFFKVWFGEKMQKYRKDVLTDKSRIPLCKGCHR